MYTLWLFGFVFGLRKISADRIPLAIAADVLQQSRFQDVPAYPVGKFAPPQDTAHRETAERENGAVIALYLFCRIAHMGQAVGTAGTDAVRAAGQGDVRVIPAEERQLFRHVCGEGITIAVTAEKGGTQPVVGTQLIHAGSAVSGGALQ